MPVFNEEDTVCDVLDAVRAYFSGTIIVVDDGSTDATPECLASRRDIVLLTLPENEGYGAALRHGFTLAADMGVARLVTMDCDGQHEPAHIPQFLTALEAGTDIVSGSRYLPDSGASGIAAPGQRREVNARVTTEINRVTGWGLTDAFCGFKAYRLDALRDLAIAEPGYAMPLEMWAKAWRAGLTVREIPVERIYCDNDRTFGEHLDDPDARMRYYMDVWNRALTEAA
jgi:dolichol-phosphate mannosyltransferase